ncbi:MAG: DUF6787 family protein [Cytophagales bacterium]|nr:DUF6787 family protein [Cytophagales bacterium]
MNLSTIKQRLEDRWGVKGWLQLFIIIVVFALTGSSSVYVAKFILPLLGITPDMNPWVRIPLRILIIFPVYQILFLWIGFLFGQFHFCWNFEKKMYGRIAGLFRKSAKTEIVTE